MMNDIEYPKVQCNGNLIATHYLTAYGSLILLINTIFFCLILLAKIVRHIKVNLQKNIAVKSGI